VHSNTWNRLCRALPWFTLLYFALNCFALPGKGSWMYCSVKVYFALRCTSLHDNARPQYSKHECNFCPNPYNICALFRHPCVFIVKEEIKSFSTHFVSSKTAKERPRYGALCMCPTVDALTSLRESDRLNTACVSCCDVLQQRTTRMFGLELSSTSIFISSRTVA
jgi:hypothetical protein